MKLSISKKLRFILSSILVVFSFAIVCSAFASPPPGSSIAKFSLVFAYGEKNGKTSIILGDTVTLSWNTVNAASVTGTNIPDFPQNQESGELTFAPTEDGTFDYSIAVAGKYFGEQVTRTVTIIVTNPESNPPTVTFNGKGARNSEYDDQFSIVTGDVVNLRWSTINAISCKGTSSGVTGGVPNWRNDDKLLNNNVAGEDISTLTYVTTYKFYLSCVSTKNVRTTKIVTIITKSPVNITMQAPTSANWGDPFRISWQISSLTGVSGCRRSTISNPNIVVPNWTNTFFANYNSYQTTTVNTVGFDGEVTFVITCFNASGFPFAKSVVVNIFRPHLTMMVDAIASAPYNSRQPIRYLAYPTTLVPAGGCSITTTPNVGTYNNLNGTADLITAGTTASITEMIAVALTCTNTALGITETASATINVESGNAIFKGNNDIQALIMSKGSFVLTGPNSDFIGSFVAKDFNLDANTSPNVRFFYDYSFNDYIPPGFRYLNLPKSEEVGNR